MRTPTSSLSAAALALVFSASLSACSSGNDSEISTSEAGNVVATLTNCDTTITIDEPIERAVAVNQPAVELLLSLGLQDRMTGYAMSDDGVLKNLEQARTQVQPFDVEFPSFEAVLEREPDFVYSTFDYTFTPEGIADRDRFTEMGISTYQSPSECSGQEAQQTDALTLDDLYAEIGDIATLFDVQDRGDELVAELQERAANATIDLGVDDITLAWWYASTKTPYFAGCCGAPGLMTSAIGAVNTFADSKQYWPEVSWESVFDRDPDVLVLADLDRGSDGDSAAAKIAFLESDPVASQLTAVKNKRYIVLDGTTMDPSIRNIGGTEQIANELRRMGLAQ